MKRFLEARKLSRVLALLFVLLVFVPFLLLAAVTSIVSERYAKESYGNYMEQVLASVANQIDGVCSRYADSAINFYYNGIVDILEENSGSEEADGEIVQKLGEMHDLLGDKYITAIYIETPRRLYMVGKRYEGFQELIDTYGEAVAAKNGRHLWSDVVTLIPKSRSGEKLIFAKALNGVQEKNIAQVYMVVDLEEFIACFLEEKTGQAIPYLLNDRGELLYYGGGAQNPAFSEFAETGQFSAQSAASADGKQLSVQTGSAENGVQSSAQTGAVREGVAELTASHHSYLRISRVSKKTEWEMGYLVPMKAVLSEFRPIKILQAAMTVIICLFLLLILLLIEKYVVRPIRVLTDRMDAFAQGGQREGTETSVAAIGEISRLNRHFDRMSANIGELITKNAQKEREKNEFKLEALQAQLSPHFIYNALNTIKWMAVINRQDNIRDLTGALIVLLRSAAKGGAGEAVYAARRNHSD